MKDTTKYVGLDVSKEKIAVAIADEGREAPRYWGVCLNTPEAIKKLMNQLGKPEQLKVCYEAGPTGYPIYRLLLSLGIECSVIAPSLIPAKPGQRVKTDRRDAIRLSQLFRAGELTSIYVPSEDDEALRDLVRAREDCKEDQLRARHRLTNFLLRYDLNPPAGTKKWSSKYRDWLDALKFSRTAQSTVFQEYLHHLDEIEERIKRVEAEIHIQATESVNAPLIRALQTMRGVAELTAISLVAEIGSFIRFDSARRIMAYTGLVPSEHSSGETRHQGKMTKTGNTHVRRLLIEAAWSYRYKPALKGEIRKRQEGQPPEIKAIAWKAQERLHRKYNRLMGRGKTSGKVIAAVARELAGFVWAIACQVEKAA